MRVLSEIILMDFDRVGGATVALLLKNYYAAAGLRNCNGIEHDLLSIR